MAMQRPGRPSTRLNQPAVNVPAPKPAARPATGAVPRQQAPAPATGRARSSGSSTRSVAKQSSSRPVPKQAAKSNTTMMIAIGGGLVVVLGIAAFAMSGGGSHEKPETSVKKEASKPKPVDVSGLETQGLSKCNEGLALIQKHQDLLSNHSMSDSQKSMLKADLEKSRKLIGEGMGLLTQANEKSKNTYDTKQYQEALITVRKKLMELRD
jgi:hypothetical protein